MQDALEKAIQDSEVLVAQYKDLEQTLTDAMQANQRMANQVIALKLQIEAANQALLAPQGKIAPTGMCLSLSLFIVLFVPINNHKNNH